MQKNYLKPILNPEKMNGTIGEANMFLAEDRILCLSIYCQTQSKYKYYLLFIFFLITAYL